MPNQLRKNLPYSIELPWIMALPYVSQSSMIIEIVQWLNLTVGEDNYHIELESKGSLGNEDMFIQYVLHMHTEQDITAFKLKFNK